LWLFSVGVALGCVMALVMSSLALLISLAGFVLSLASFCWTSSRSRDADVLAAATRKAEVLIELQGVLALIGQLRLRYDWWTTLTQEPKAKELMRPSLEQLKTIEEMTGDFLNEIRPLDPKKIATQPKARERLETLYGRAKEQTVQATGLLEQVKRMEGEIERLLRPAVPKQEGEVHSTPKRYLG
jgi:hypothetical protein